MPSAAVLLTVRDVEKHFGGLTALQGLSFEVRRGEILGLIGVNGSGKTTIMNCISGLYRADAGSIRLDGIELIGRAPHRIAGLGVGRTFQVPKVFRRMTLVDNLLIPVLGEREADAELEDRARGILASLSLGELEHNYADELSGGQQKLLELGRLMMFDPPLILLDEPFAGVNPTLCNFIAERLLDLQRKGISFVLVSHDMASVARLCDRVMVLDNGRKIAEGSLDEVRRDPLVIEAYLGGGG